MRFTVVTSGSEGDTRPLASLCRGLLDHGHEVKLFADGSTLSLPRALAVPCEALAGNIKTILPTASLHEKLRLSELIRVGKNLKAYVEENSASWLRAVGEHAGHSDAILFCSLATLVGLTLRDELRKTAIGLAFQPASPTREFCSPQFRPRRLPGRINLWTYSQTQRQFWKLFADSAPKARHEVFGTVVTRRPDWGFPMLYGISRELVSRPADWPTNHVICGHWCSPMGSWIPPRDLLDFIGVGPPIYAGFGSPSAFIRANALRALIDAVGNHRVVFSPGWSDIDRSVLPENFFVARDVPHEWLFPRARLAIHHGGAGTTHTAARAGLPQVILPFGADQFFWAHRVAARGAAPKTSRKAATNAHAIAKMIAFAERESTRKSATQLAEAMAREDGVRKAVKEIETLVERRTE